MLYSEYQSNPYHDHDTFWDQGSVVDTAVTLPGGKKITTHLNCLLTQETEEMMPRPQGALVYMSSGHRGGAPEERSPGGAELVGNKRFCV